MFNLSNFCDCGPSFLVAYCHQAWLCSYTLYAESCRIILCRQ